MSPIVADLGAILVLSGAAMAHGISVNPYGLLVATCNGRSSACRCKKLLAGGKTDLLAFVSARTRRPFAA
jgi:hypothetical protein